MSTKNYGDFYWCVKVSDDISPSKEIYLHADRVEIAPDGSLEFWAEDKITGKPKFQNLIIHADKWKVVFAAGVADGSAVAVDYWSGEVVRR